MGTIYQLGTSCHIEPFSKVYTPLNLLNIYEVRTKFPDSQIQSCLGEYVGIWYVWQYKRHNWVGFTSENQLVKGKSPVIFHNSDEVTQSLGRCVDLPEGPAPVDMLAWCMINCRATWGVTVAHQAEICHPGINEISELIIGCRLPELDQGLYCNYFAMRWDTFDAYMRWSFPIVERMITMRDDPRVSVSKGHTSTLGGLVERLPTIWLQKYHKTCLVLDGTNQEFYQGDS